MDAVELSASRRATTARVSALLVVLTSVLSWTVPDQASAHAGLVRSDPRDGASLVSAPDTVTLTFDEAIGSPAYVVVTTPDGTRADQGAAELDGGTVTQALHAPAAAAQSGRWTVAFRVVSVDGHPVSGELSFSVAGKRSGGTAAAATASAVAGGQTSPWSAHAGALVLGVSGLVAAALLLWWPGGGRRGV